jgi:hypothetical protein
MSKSRADREYDDRANERMHRMGGLAYLIYREWWHPLRNRKRRREVRALRAEDDQEYAAYLARKRAS